MSRRTIVIPNRLAWHTERFRAAEEHVQGIQILTPSQLAGRLVGGFTEVASRDSCHTLARDALANLDLVELAKLREMPGAVSAICRTLAKAWDADLNLQALAAQSTRICDLARIEAYVREHLPFGMMLQRELVSAATEKLPNACRVFGSLVVRGFVFVNPRWQRLFLALAESLSIEWHSLESAKDHLAWIRNAPISLMVEPTRVPRQNSVVCATPKHEVVQWDGDFRVLVEDGQLPVHLVHGRSATSTFSGQQAGSMAALLLGGLSHDRVVRALRLLRNTTKLN